jgi:hypothetical protein
MLKVDESLERKELVEMEYQAYSTRLARFNHPFFAFLRNARPSRVVFAGLPSSTGSLSHQLLQRAAMGDSVLVVWHQLFGNQQRGTPSSYPPRQRGRQWRSRFAACSQKNCNLPSAVHPMRLSGALFAP